MLDFSTEEQRYAEPPDQGKPFIGILLSECRACGHLSQNLSRLKGQYGGEDVIDTSQKVFWRSDRCVHELKS